MNTKKDYALVLAGGGTKGAYQVGVWKALKELDISVKAIAGTSIGALNGALILQEDFNLMVDLYSNIELKNIMEITEDIDTNKNLFDITNIGKVATSFINNKGIENEPLKNLIKKYINIEKIYNSEIDFGLVTYSIKDKKPLQLFKEQIPPKDMVDYLMASSCFPIFKAQKIDGMELMDGGLYDNSPINMIIEKGYKNIIVVDIEGPGLNRKMIYNHIYLKKISPKQNLGGMFEFNHDKIKNNMELGYLDTMKSFNKMQGHIYYFYSQEFKRMLELFNLQNIYGLENAAKLYGINKYKPYKFEEFIELLYKKHNEAKEKYEKLKSTLKGKELNNLKDNLEKILDSELSICFATDLYLKKPMSKRFSYLRKILKNYFESVEALIELENYLK